MPPINRKPVTIRGITYASYAEAADAYGVSSYAIRSRHKAGTLDDLEVGGNKNRLVNFNGKQYGNMAEAARVLGVHTETLRRVMIGNEIPPDAESELRIKLNFRTRLYLAKHGDHHDIAKQLLETIAEDDLVGALLGD